MIYVTHILCERNGGAHPGMLRMAGTFFITRLSKTHRLDASGQDVCHPNLYEGEPMDDPDEDTACINLHRRPLYRWNTAYLYALRMHYRYVFLRLKRFMT